MAVAFNLSEFIGAPQDLSLSKIPSNRNVLSFDMFVRIKHEVGAKKPRNSIVHGIVANGVLAVFHHLAPSTNHIHNAVSDWGSGIRGSGENRDSPSTGGKVFHCH